LIAVALKNGKREREREKEREREREKERERERERKREREREREETRTVELFPGDVFIRGQFCSDASISRNLPTNVGQGGSRVR
jgi:hypothetical protein